MMRRGPAFLGALLAILALGAFVPRTARADGGSPKTVKVAAVRAFLMGAPRHFAKTVAVLHAGDEVEVLGQVAGADWFHVRYRHRAGFLPLQALASGAYGLRAGSNRGAAKTSGTSIQLAARAFGPEVETKYHGDHPAVDYHLVDAMEAVVPSPSQVRAFAAAGGVDLGGSK